MMLRMMALERINQITLCEKAFSFRVVQIILPNASKSNTERISFFHPIDKPASSLLGVQALTIGAPVLSRHARSPP